MHETNPSIRTSRAKPLSVSDLNGAIKGLIEGVIPHVWVCGEVSTFRPARSGHWYFSLKDEHSVVRVNMWRSYTFKIDFEPKEGDEVMVYGPMNVYSPRGEYSLVAEWMEPLGKGRLRAEFELMKARLKEEGLFDSIHKKKCPYLPQRVGVVTSPTGAALQDILRVLDRRFSGLTIIVSPARVQGEGAAKELAEALEKLDRDAKCDVIIIARGGGSEEDLWAFNDEILARAIFRAKTPIVSAVGHEIDVSISDFVADLRAATPSQAAELIVPTSEECAGKIKDVLKKLESRLLLRLHEARNKVKALELKRVFPQTQLTLHDRQRHVDEQINLLSRKLESRIGQLMMRNTQLLAQLNATNLGQKTAVFSERVTSLTTTLNLRCQSHVHNRRKSFQNAVSRLDDLSPLKILSRGYAVLKKEDGAFLREAEKVTIGETLEATLHKGALKVVVKAKSD